MLSDPAQIAWASLVSSFLIVLLIGLSIQQSQLLQSARLIWDNRIWVVPVTRLDQGSGSAFLVEETVLSTFGLLSASQIYEWGRRGRWGTRLRTMEIDPTNMRLSFGNRRSWILLEFQHGIETGQGVLEVAEKLRRETGVAATIRGW